MIFAMKKYRKVLFFIILVVSTIGMIIYRSEYLKLRYTFELGGLFNPPALPWNCLFVNDSVSRSFDDTNLFSRPQNTWIKIDKNGLQRQIEEKTLQKEFNNAIERKHNQLILSAAEAAEKMEKQSMEAKRRMNEDLNLFRETYQRKEDRREYDISNPSKGTTYENVDGISAGQSFEGEDSKRIERKLSQIVQQKNWLIQQMSEKSQTNKEKEMAENIFMDNLSSRERRALVLDKLEKDCRRQIHIATKAYNEALARENDLKKRVEKEKEVQDNLTHIMNTINSDILTENTEVCQSNLGQNKVLQYHYKGMSADELREIRKIQLRQIELNKAKLQEEALHNEKWSAFYRSVDELLVSRTQFQQDQEREYMKRIMEENKILKVDQNFRQRCERKNAESNFSTPEFLSKFNQTSR